MLGKKAFEYQKRKKKIRQNIYIEKNKKPHKNGKYGRVA